MGLRDVESGLPPGFRFFPSDEELVCHYLHKKVARLAMKEETMVEIDLHTCEPWELPEVAKLSVNEWYFFSFRDRKYATGSRTNRATKSGYWKATGKDRTIYNPSARNEIIGMRKTLVFYSGRAPNGIKSSWVMHEFRLENSHSLPKEDWVLCRVFNKRKEEEGSAITSSSSSPLLSRDCPLEGRMYKHIGPLLSGDDHDNSYLCPTYESIDDFNDMSNLMSFNVPQAEIEDFGFLMDVGL